MTKFLAYISHLPHAVAYSLVETIPAEYLEFSVQGLRHNTHCVLLAADVD